MVTLVRHKNRCQVCLRPNCSATWGQTKLLIAGLGSVALIVAAAWSLAGAWLILPFAGLEVSLLAYLAYRVCRDTYNQQVLHIEPGHVMLTQGRHHKIKQWRLKRAQSCFVISAPAHSLSPRTVELKDQHQSCIIGEKLNQQDTEQLIDIITHLEIPYRMAGKTKITAIQDWQ